MGRKTIYRTHLRDDCSAHHLVLSDSGCDCINCGIKAIEHINIGQKLANFIDELSDDIAKSLLDQDQDQDWLNGPDGI